MRELTILLLLANLLQGLSFNLLRRSGFKFPSSLQLQPSYREQTILSEPISPATDIKKKGKYLILGSILSLVGSQFRANAGFFSTQEQDQIDEISKFQKPIAELLDQLRPTSTPNAIGVYSTTQILKGGKEDSDVVLSYLEFYIKPCQRVMESVAGRLKLSSEEDQKNIELQPLLMKGHIAELTQAIQSMKAVDQEREVKEVFDTLADFLKLASTKYTVQPYVPSRPLTDAELFGPLGCQFWGKKRVEGSNACADIE
eukprot:gene29709-38840_t